LRAQFDRNLHTRSAYGSFPGGNLASSGFASGGQVAGTKWESMAAPGKRRAVFLDATVVINKLLFARQAFPPPVSSNWSASWSS